VSLKKHFRGDWQPLINGEEKIVVIWSPKSACSTVLIWHFHRLGVLKAARMYHGWPHDYRAQVLNNAEATRHWAVQANEKYTYIRVIRDPIKRAISCFRHSLRYDLIKLSADKGYSFLEFLEFLLQNGVRTDEGHFAFIDNGQRLVDGHFRPQYQPIESEVVCDVINADKEDLYQALNRIEAGLGLSVTDFTAIGWISEIANIHNSAKATRLYYKASPQEVLTRQHAEEAWPDARTLVDKQSEALIREIYSVDFERYSSVI
jgi:hypothetical protein